MTSCLDLFCKIQENRIHINIYFKLNLGSGISGNYLKLYAEVCKWITYILLSLLFFPDSGGLLTHKEFRITESDFWI